MMSLAEIALGFVGVIVIIIVIATISALFEERAWVFRRLPPKTRPPISRPTSKPRGPAPEPPPTSRRRGVPLIDQPPWMPENPVFEGQSLLVDPECKYCGRPNNPGTEYCRGCGAPMGGKVRTPRPKAPPSQEASR